ncbi:MAG: hypothetical protein HY686_00475 [Chloroflexi bacterium]|nr:hypothetical protein [Chloroflexota bacterium]
MSDYLQGALALQRALTAISSAYNVLHFVRLRTNRRGRRVAAGVLALVNTAFLAQALYPTLARWLARWADGPGLLLLAGGLPLMASVAITALVLRQRLHRQGNGR